MIKHGIFCAYWEKPSGTPVEFFVDKANTLGFDIMELGANHIMDRDEKGLRSLRDYADEKGIGLTVGFGPPERLSICSEDEAVREAGIMNMTALIEKMGSIGVRIVGGGLHAYWPVTRSDVDKAADRRRGVESLRRLAPVAEKHNVYLCLEILNRFENHILNTAKEAVAYVREISSPNVKIMLDTFHMNIEEDSIPAAIRTAGAMLGHFHTGESNRKVPGKGHLPWRQICEALIDIGYRGAAVMEPFVRDDGGAAKYIRVWRMLADGGEEKMDRDAADALRFFKYTYESCLETN
jgi:D-psicose/D-tagatose/L-ribulose 3-epimerase